MRSSNTFTQAERSSKKAHKIQIANKLIDTMVNLEQNFEVNQRRWIWELIQNAKDVCHQKVKIKICLKPDSLEFSHTGKPFQTEDLVFLIEQTSSKKREEEKKQEYEIENEEEKEQKKNTGKFGTGFISTHLLSRKVKIKGIWKGEEKQYYKRFQLDLDRSPLTQKEMIKKIEEAFNVFKAIDEEDIISDYKPGERYNTKFIYELNEKGLKVALAGLKDLQLSALLTMLFNKEIVSIRVDDQISKIKQKFFFIESIIYKEFGGKIFSKEIFEIYQDDKIFSKNYLTYSDENVKTVCEIISDDQNSYSLVQKPDMAPVIFADFPLIGSETFPYPFYFNSHYFFTNEPRSGLITLGDLDEVKSNKALLKILKRQSIKLMTFICQSEIPILNRHLMAITKNPDNLDLAWYKANIQTKVREALYNLPIIENSENIYINFAECMIPSADIHYVLDLHDLISPIFDKKLIKKNLDYIVYWLNEFNKDWEGDLKVKNLFDIYNLFDFVDGKKEVKELIERLDFYKEYDVFEWLNKIYAYMYETIPKNECDKILEDLALIPNQNGFLSKMSTLYVDEEIPDFLKDILFNLGYDVRKELINNDIFIEGKKSMDIHVIIAKIDKFYEEKEKTGAEILLNVSFELLSIFPKDKNNKKIREILLEIIQFVFKPCITKKETMDMHNITSLWEKAELYIIKSIIKIIENNQSLDSLGNFTKQGKSTILSLLNNFYQIIYEKNWGDLIKDKRIYPNQLGLFNFAKDLMVDKVDEELFGEEEKYENNDMRQGMENSNLHEHLIDVEKLSNSFKEIVKNITGEERIGSILLNKSIVIQDHRLITKEMHLKDITMKIEKILQERRNTLSNDKEMRKLVKNLYDIVKNLKPEIVSQYFRWFEQNIHSIMADTITDEKVKKVILEMSLMDQKDLDAALLIKILNKSLKNEDLLLLMKNNNLNFPLNNNDPLEIHNNSFGMGPRANFERNSISDLNDSDSILFSENNNHNIQTRLIDLNITTSEQFNKLIETKKIKMPQSGYRPSEEAFQYVLRILEESKKNVWDYLYKTDDYDLTDAIYDKTALNKNILLNVRKNKLRINIVVRPSIAKKIIIHNEREVMELDNPNNELWFSDGENVGQMTMGKIFRSNDFRIIKL